MFYLNNKKSFGLFILIPVLALFSTVYPQDSIDGKSASIGGEEHDSSIYGVRIGMDVPTALQAVFVNAARAPGQEKPDAMRNEGKDKKDIRVLYKDLPKGELQIVFANGKIVREITLRYRQTPLVDDLRLPYTATIGSNDNTIFATSASQPGSESPAINDGSTGIIEFGNKKQNDIDKFSAKKVGNISRSQAELLDGARYDDRYSVGFTDNLKQQKIWWRDEKTVDDFKIRVAFIGKKITEAGAKFVASIVQKTISIAPDDESNFKKFVLMSGKKL